MTTPTSSQAPTVARPVDASRREPLYGADATRRIEREALARLPAHTLMSRAGLSVARLARALHPHARMIWVACGPGNNGGDGLLAAIHLHQWAQARGGSQTVVVTHWIGEPADESGLPADARNALAAARQAGVVFADRPPLAFDLAIDALFGLGAARPVQGRLGEWLALLRGSSQTVLCVDLPSGLHADTGALAPAAGVHPHPTPRPGPRHTLSLLTLKPGLFTAHGRDAAGQVWLDGLGESPSADEPATAWLAGRAPPAGAKADQAHVSHKGSFGDVVVVGGQGISVGGAGMTGAALLAARAALHAGAGRVFVGLLQRPDAVEPTWDPVNPELMFRRPESLLDTATLQQACVVCGCGGGKSIASVLPRVLSGTARLVLDADALNAIATDSGLQTLLRHRLGRGWTTVLTPHPLEAARLLGCDTATVMADRLKSAQSLAESFGVVCVLKGSGTVLAAASEVPWINPTGNASLATAGTGDVLAGMVGAALASPLKANGPSVLQRVAEAVFQHGWLADHWPCESSLNAGALAARVQTLS
ncbi:MAG: NAD(P)H-hydrate dehydratase [Hydrogenophaga sp.]|uniref:NAD(P)H-hydrate dehydratase n=1 Tax=Hydrogenophaga sp. TaxID=1904254 RepID=UPI003D151A85